MADKAEQPVADKVPHDRVVGLSLRKDGTPDQNDPEMIGPKDSAVAASKAQFREFAVSAVDHERRTAEAAPADEGDSPKEDAASADRRKEHEKVAAAAEKKAESVVNSLHKG